MPTLDTAVPLKEVEHAAVLVAKHLHLHMAGTLNKLLHENLREGGRVGEGRGGRGGEGRGGRGREGREGGRGGREGRGGEGREGGRKGRKP